MAVDDSGSPGTGQDSEQRLLLREVYLKDASFEAPHVPAILYAHIDPQLTFELHHSCRRYLDPREEYGEVYEVVLRVTVQAEAKGEGRILFATEVQQVGLFEVKGYADSQRDWLLRTKGVEALYPYAKEAVSSLIGRAGFPRIAIYPVDFEARYAKLLDDHRNSVAAPTTADGTVAT